MSSKIPHKMNSALLAMSLSYYYVMEDYVEKEQKADEILSILLENNANGGPNARGQSNFIILHCSYLIIKCKFSCMDMQLIMSKCFCRNWKL